MFAHSRSVYTTFPTLERRRLKYLGNIPPLTLKSLQTALFNAGFECRQNNTQNKTNNRTFTHAWRNILYFIWIKT
jgi:hypothetical protein